MSTPVQQARIARGERSRKPIVRGGLAKDVIDQIQSLMLEQGVNRSDLAQAFGISKQGMSFKFIHADFRLSDLERIAAAFAMRICVSFEDYDRGEPDAL